MTELLPVKWIDGLGRVRWGIDDQKGRRRLRRGELDIVYFGPIESTAVARYRTQRKALRAGDRVLQREARHAWHIEEGWPHAHESTLGSRDD